jgi:hypothetical protein
MCCIHRGVMRTDQSRIRRTSSSVWWMSVTSGCKRLETSCHRGGGFPRHKLEMVHLCRVTPRWRPRRRNHAQPIHAPQLLFDREAHVALRSMVSTADEVRSPIALSKCGISPSDRLYESTRSLPTTATERAPYTCQRASRTHRRKRSAYRHRVESPAMLPNAHTACSRTSACGQRTATPRARVKCHAFRNGTFQ